MPLFSYVITIWWFFSYFIPLFAFMCMIWCVEDELYVEYAEVEDFQDFQY
jgi:hypothetical protein